MVQWMVTSNNHVIAGPDLHRAGPLAIWRFSQHLSAKYIFQDQKKILQFQLGAPSWHCVIGITSLFFVF